MDELSTRDHPDWWKNIGGQNSQDSILERRSLVWNDNGVEAPDAPPAFHTGEEGKGKFFTRGCRGKIERIEVYCRAPMGGNITLRYTVYPGMGPLNTVTFAPGAAWAWQGIDIEQMWNYDSLFIILHDIAPTIEWGYDAVQPHDGHEATDPFPTWADMAIRPYIRAIYTAETPGDVPVSGIVNVIKVPATGGEVAFEENVDVADDTPTRLVYFEGAGTMLQATILVQDDDLVLPTNPWGGVMYSISVRADGEAAFYADNRYFTQSPVAAAGRSSCGEFLLVLVPDSGLKWLVMNLRVPIEFVRRISLHFHHRAGAVLATDGFIYANVIG